MNEGAREYCPPEPRRIVVMGVSGSGKSAVGRRLASRLGVAFVDGDDYHPPSNVEKMASGQPLDDEDREPWLDALNRVLVVAGPSGREGEGMVLACSALKQTYRDRLHADLAPGAITWIHLRASRATLAERLAARRDHFMPSQLLDSQLQTLEPPSDAIVVDVDRSLDDVVESCVRALT